MSSFQSELSTRQIALIQASKVFFVASADPQLAAGPDGAGPVNLSPKGGTPLHVLSSRRIAYLDYPGSGNETARHAAQGGPITVMVCSFEQDDPAIVRIYGRARVEPIADSELARLLLQQQAPDLSGRPRQAIEIAIDRTMTSCGYGVPVLSYVRDRSKSERGRRFK